MTTYFIEFHAGGKSRALFVRYKSDIMDEYCQQDIRKNIMKAYPDAVIDTISRQIERASQGHASVQKKIEEAP